MLADALAFGAAVALAFVLAAGIIFLSTLCFALTIVWLIEIRNMRRRHRERR